VGALELGTRRDECGGRSLMLASNNWENGEGTRIARI